MIVLGNEYFKFNIADNLLIGDLEILKPHVEQIIREYTGKRSESETWCDIEETLHELCGDRYTILCDSSNNPPEVVDTCCLAVDIGLNITYALLKNMLEAAKTEGQFEKFIKSNRIVGDAPKPVAETRKYILCFEPDSSLTDKNHIQAYFDLNQHLGKPVSLEDIVNFCLPLVPYKIEDDKVYVRHAHEY